MIRTVDDADLPEVRDLIEACVRQDVARTGDEAEFLVADIDESLSWWRGNRTEGLHLKFVENDRILGVVLVKHHWNLTNLFVHPDAQGRGIGRSLVETVLKHCRDLSPRSKLLVNSSANAVGFYQALGFHQTGPGRDRPGGCVPFEYGF